MRHLIAVVIVTGLTACNCGPRTSCVTTSDCAQGQVCARNVCQASGPNDGGSNDAGQVDAGPGDAGTTDAGSHAVATSLKITPDMVTLQSVNGSTPTQQLSATVTFSDGSTIQSSDVVYDVDQLAVGSVAALGGLFTASGRIGGTATVHGKVTVSGITLNASTTVHVVLSYVTNGPGVTGTPANSFTTLMQDAARAAAVVYPLDGVVFPQNVAPADVQWTNGNVGDLFRVRLVKPDITVQGFVKDDGTHHWLVDAASWKALAQTNAGVAATLTVDRYDSNAGQAIAGAPRALRFVKAALSGSIYYWDIVAGRIVRIDDGTTNRTEFMPSPPAAINNEHCVGCHVVSPSGRYMAGRLGGGENIGAIFDLTTNLTGNPPPTVWPIDNTGPLQSSPRWWFASFSPDENRLVMSTNEGGGTPGLTFMNPKTGQMVSVANAPGGLVTHPAWSPDGKTILYVNNIDSWGGAFTKGDIYRVTVTAPDTLSAPASVHLGNSLPGGAADSYPTWSPDSKHIAFAHGTGTRSESAQASLFQMDSSGANVVRLDKASGGVGTVDTFQPRYSPFVTDGYHWLTFLSKRSYGNTKVGTQHNEQQIWVAAIKQDAGVGQDPSEVGFWLPGQATTSQNIAAFWAPRACRATGQGCSVGSECCSGDCRADTGGSLVCSPPPIDRCRLEGESCNSASDCCADRVLTCSNNTCIIDIQ